MRENHGPLPALPMSSYLLRRPGAAYLSASPAWRSSARISTAPLLLVLLVLGLSAAAACEDEKAKQTPCERLSESVCNCKFDGPCDDWADYFIDACEYNLDGVLCDEACQETERCRIECSKLDDCDQFVDCDDTCLGIN